MKQIAVENFAQDVGLAQRYSIPFGYSVEEIAHYFHDSLENLTAWVKAPHGYHAEWIEVPRCMWRLMRPKIDGVLKFGYRLAKNALKSLFAIVATVAVSVVAPWLAGTSLFSVFGTFAGAAATAALTVGVSLLSNTLFPASSAAQQSGYEAEGTNNSAAFTNVDSDNNILAKEAYLPVVAGLRRVSLPEIAQPRAFLDPASGLQTLHRIFALNGEHSISEIKVNGVAIEDDDSFRYTVIGGSNEDTTETFVDKTSWQNNISAELSNFTLDDSLLVDQETPSNSEPRWEKFTTRYDPRIEAIYIRLSLTSMIKSSDAGTNVRVPVRVRFREADSDDEWTNLPEIHFIGNLSTTTLQEITLRWDKDFGVADTSGDISHNFFQRVPEATAGTLSSDETGDQWQAHAQFVSDSGLRDVQNISGGRNGIRITLDESQTPKAKYEFEVKRGFASSQSDLTLSSYQYSGQVHSFFEGYSKVAGWSIATAQSDYLGRLQLSFVTSVADIQPCQRPGTALLAIESKGQSIKNVTALCGAKVADWDGEAWTGKTTTKNPACHYYSFLSKFYSHHGTSANLIDDDAIVAFRNECEEKGYEVSGLFAGSTIADTLQTVAVAGLATPAVSIGIGVDWFRDRSSDRPVQTFSPRNCSSISIDINHGSQPMGIRAKFQNEEKDFVDDEIEVNNPFYTSDKFYEVQEYPTITNPDLVLKRAYFDMLQIHYQSRRGWVLDTSIEGLVCEKGDLVGVVTDLLDDSAFGARITAIESSTIFSIDQEIPVAGTDSLYDTDNIFDQSDVFEVGEQSVVFISTVSGVHQSIITGVSGRTIRIADPLPNSDVEGAHITIGPISNFMNRCIVSQVNRLDEERAQLVLVDEAPEIFQALEAKFK